MGALPWQPEPLPPFLLLRAVPHTFTPHYSPPFGIFAPFFNPFPQRYRQTLKRGRREGSARTFRSLLKLFPPFPHRAGGVGGEGRSPPSPQNIPVSMLKEPSPASPWGSPQAGGPSPPPWLRDRRHFVLPFKPSTEVVLRGKRPRTLTTTPLAPPLPKFPETTVIKL